MACLPISHRYQRLTIRPLRTSEKVRRRFFSNRYSLWIEPWLSTFPGFVQPCYYLDHEQLGNGPSNISTLAISFSPRSGICRRHRCAQWFPGLQVGNNGPNFHLSWEGRSRSQHKNGCHLDLTSPSFPKNVPLADIESSMRLIQIFRANSPAGLVGEERSQYAAWQCKKSMFVNSSNTLDKQWDQPWKNGSRLFCFGPLRVHEGMRNLAIVSWEYQQVRSIG